MPKNELLSKAGLKYLPRSDKSNSDIDRPRCLHRTAGHTPGRCMVPKNSKTLADLAAWQLVMHSIT